MQIPRDLSGRMLQAADEVPIVDVYERLLPERRRVGQRVDFIAWWMAHAAQEMGGLGLSAEDAALLGNVEANPDERWKVLARYWPFVRTTASGRLALRMAWELAGVENIDQRTWKDVSAYLWREAEPGFYQARLQERAHIERVLTVGGIDEQMRERFVPIWNVERRLAIDSRPALEGWAKALDCPISLTRDLVDDLIAESLDRQMANGCAAVKIGALPEPGVPSEEEVVWALGRISRRDGPSLAREPALERYLLHRLLVSLGARDLPLQVHVQTEGQVDRLRALVMRYPEVRFLGVCTAGVGVEALSALGRSCANVYVALVGLWQLEPHVIRQTLQRVLCFVPGCKILAVGGDVAMIEALCVQALMIREQVALALAEMTVEGMLDEEDAALIMSRVLYRNAVAYFGLV
jgi:hypothetical protein